MREVYICDTTLRDGRQMPGVYFTLYECVEIAKKLDAIGVDQIEVFSPGYVLKDYFLIRELNKIGLADKLLVWHRGLKVDLEKSLNTKLDFGAVALSIATEKQHREKKLKMTKEQIIENICEAVSYAKDHGLYVSVNAEKSVGTEPEYLINFANAVTEAGADRIRYCDTLGELIPHETYRIISELAKKIKVDLEFHGHDDMGMGVGNTLEAFRAGAKWLDTSVCRLGERGGFTSLEQLVYNLYKHFNIRKYDVSKLADLAYFVEKVSGITPPPNTPITGLNIYRHESGIHAHGVLRDVNLYEKVRAAEVGIKEGSMKDKIVIGETTGRESIIYILKEYGINVEKNNPIINKILNKIQEQYLFGRKTSVNHKEVVELYHIFSKKNKIKPVTTIAEF
ncbi:MAG: homoaconitate hydratase [Candidatus Freyrarchaeum guaymaensis]|nr:homoaconitate hydratase [Candidatus Sigynarchaeota archaeon]